MEFGTLQAIVMAGNATPDELADYEIRSNAIEKRLVDGLISVYRTHPVAIAKLCDEHLDRSGKLLGEIRTAARTSLNETEHE